MPRNPKKNKLQKASETKVPVNTYGKHGKNKNQLEDYSSTVSNENKKKFQSKTDNNDLLEQNAPNSSSLTSDKTMAMVTAEATIDTCGDCLTMNTKNIFSDKSVITTINTGTKGAKETVSQFSTNFAKSVDSKTGSTITNESNVETTLCIDASYSDGISVLNDLQHKPVPQFENSNSELKFSNNQPLKIFIETPEGQRFEVDITSLTYIQDLYSLLMDHDATCHRTCYWLLLNDHYLDIYAKIRAITELKNGITLKIIEKSYTTREARIHVLHVQRLLKFLNIAGAYNGVDCSSLSVLPILIPTMKSDEKKTYKSSIDCTPPDYLIPGQVCKLPLLPLHPNIKENGIPPALKTISASFWNPPPAVRRLHGDLLYVYVHTIENKRFHITASPKGFYVNRSTDAVFDPKADSQSCLSHSLIDILSKLSPAFYRFYQIILKRREMCHPYERLATPFQIYQWSGPILEQTVDGFRAEDTFSVKLNCDDCMPDNSRNWNEDLQRMRELPRKTLEQRIIRDSAIFEVHADFLAAAIKGAIDIIDGNILALNPNEKNKMQMFIFNNIFFSLGFEVHDYYKNLAGEYASFVAPRHDLYGVRSYSNIDLPGLYTLGTVLIDYRSYRVTGQTIIPGTIEREQESLVYGSIGSGNNVIINKEYLKLLKEAGKQLHLIPHWVLNEKNIPMELYCSVESNGIIGSDKRHYILDLLRTFPIDVNFLPPKDKKPNKPVCPIGAPFVHSHLLCCLRLELLEAYDKELMENTKVTNNELKTKTFGFNPDVFITGIRHYDTPQMSPSVHEQHQKVKGAAEFLLQKQIPKFINDQMKLRQSILDSKELSEALHNYGINMRYLGKVVEQVATIPSLKYLHRIAVINLITRCAKHIYLRFMRVVKSIQLSSTNSHFLNCLLNSTYSARRHVNIKEKQLNMDVKRQNKQKNKVAAKNIKHTNEDTKFRLGENLSDMNCLLNKNCLWQLIQKEARTYWKFNLACKSIDDAMTIYDIRHISLLRNFCQVTGIQILLREYNFKPTNGLTFLDTDIVNIFPVVRHISPLAKDTKYYYQMTLSKISNGQFIDAHNCITETLNMLNFIYGAMHTDIVECLHLLARLCYVLYNEREAWTFQYNATIMSERVCGIDHVSTVLQYMNLSLYAFANNQVCDALRSLYRARYLITLLSSEDHPKIAKVDCTIGLILHAVGQFKLAHLYFEHALKLYKNYYGPKSLQLANCHHLTARNSACLGDFRTALSHECEAYTFFKHTFGASHCTTHGSENYLRQLTYQTASVQCRLRGGVSIAAINIPPMSSAMVLTVIEFQNDLLFPEVSHTNYEKNYPAVRPRTKTIYEQISFDNVERKNDPVAVNDQTAKNNHP